MSALLNAFKLKSKTVNFNILGGALVTLLGQFGFEISPEVVSAGFVLGNFILRLITKQPLEDK